MERTRTDQLLYVELGTGNGGILLDVSEEGCGFLSIAPIWDQEPHFAFGIGGGRQIQGEGKVVWVDSSKKLGGLRFVNATPAFREQLRAWLAEPKTDVSQPEPGTKSKPDSHTDILKPIESKPIKLAADSMLDSPAFREQVRAWLAERKKDAPQPEQEVQAQWRTDNREPIERKPIKLQGEPQPDSPAKQRRKQLREEARARMEAAEHDRALHAWKSDDARHAAAEEKRLRNQNSDSADAALGTREQIFLHGPSGRTWPASVTNGKIWKGVAGFALGGTLAALAVLYHEQAGTALMRLGTSLAGKQGQVTSVSEGGAVAGGSAPQPNQQTGAELQPAVNEAAEDKAQPTNAATSAEASKQVEQTAGTVESKTPRQSAPATPSTNAANTPAAVQKVSVKPEEPAVKTGLASQASEMKRKEPHHATAEQVQALWSEVEGGDVGAEVALGELYTRGNGVPKSCGQARMLLNSAAKKGSDEARQKLEQLADQGCP